MLLIIQTFIVFEFALAVNALATQCSGCSIVKCIEVKIEHGKLEEINSIPSAFVLVIGRKNKYLYMRMRVIRVSKS